jgi:uncharacterized alpha-E superfamily protein
MLARVADDLFWMARYVERGIAVSRLIDVTRHLELDVGVEERDFWGPLVGAVDLSAEDVSFFLLSDQLNPDSLVSCVRHARELARGVRESISSEMWEELNTLHQSLALPSAQRHGQGESVSFQRLVRQRLQYFQGLVGSTLAHDEPWHFLSLGTYLERADGVVRLLRRQAHLLAPRHDEETSDADMVRWLAVLRSCGSAEAYARFYSLRVEPARIVEFLLLNPVFPQSVRFALAAAEDALGAVAALRSAAANDPGPAVRTLGRVLADVEYAAIDEVFEMGLEEFLDGVQRSIAQVSDEIIATYLRDEPQPSRLGSVARAAVLMAAQQQQQR